MGLVSRFRALWRKAFPRAQPPVPDGQDEPLLPRYGAGTHPEECTGCRMCVPLGSNQDIEDHTGAKRKANKRH